MNNFKVKDPKMKTFVTSIPIEIPGLGIIPAGTRFVGELDYFHAVLDNDPTENNKANLFPDDVQDGFGLPENSDKYTGTVAEGFRATLKRFAELSAARWYGKDLIATSGSGVSSGSSGDIEKIVTVVLNTLNDPAGMLGADNQTITVPNGASRLMLICDMYWAAQPFAEAGVLVKVNGVTVDTRSAPATSEGAYSREQEWMTLTVSPGDKVTLQLRATYSLNPTQRSSVSLRNFRMEVLG